MKKLTAFLIGVLSTYVLAVVLVSQFNISRITDLGHSVGLGDRLQTVGHDLINMGALYLPLIAIALLIAWLFTGFVLRRFLEASTWLYALAGFVGVLVLHVALNGVFEIHAIAPTRTLAGLLSQAAAGAVGGYFFCRFWPTSASSA